LTVGKCASFLAHHVSITAVSAKVLAQPVVEPIWAPTASRSLERLPATGLDLEPTVSAIEGLSRLRSEQPERFSDKHLRTVQRAVKVWRSQQARRIILESHAGLMAGVVDPPPPDSHPRGSPTGVHSYPPRIAPPAPDRLLRDARGPSVDSMDDPKRHQALGNIAGWGNMGGQFFMSPDIEGRGGLGHALRRSVVVDVEGRCRGRERHRSRARAPHS